MHVLALAFLLVANKHKPAPPPKPPEVHFRDIHYALSLELDGQSGDFKTTVAVTLSPTAPTSTVNLDVQDLEVNTVKQGDTELAHAVNTLPDGKQQLAITLPSEAQAGASLRLLVTAHGKAKPGASMGLIKVEDPEHAGRTVYYTMFEPDGARRMFPCIDRPGDKATFDVNVTTDANLEVVSNTEPTGDEKVEGDGPAKHRVSFKQDKPMSTYLLAVAAGPFESTPITGAAVPATLLAAPGDAAKLGPVIDATKAGMTYFADFLQVPYPWARYAQVGVPQFPWHGMENTGATFLRASEAAPPTDALASRNELTRLVHHELAHQWFGDSVTPANWGEVWLSEAFATYLSRVAATDLLKNDAAFIDAMLYDRDHYFRFEDGPRSRALTGPAATEEDLFDDAAYEKGAAVLRMLEKQVGRETFRKALRNYLTEHANGTGTSDELFQAVTTASGKSLSDFKKAWLGEAGYPVLKVTHRWMEGSHNLVINVEQKPNHAGKKVIFPATLTIVAHRTAEPSFHLDVPLALTKSLETVEMNLPAEPEWLDWNQGDTVLARIDANEKVEALAAEAAKDPDAMARLWADLELAGTLADPERKGPPPSNEALSALAHALKTDHSPYVRAGLLRELVHTSAKRIPEPLASAVLEQAVSPASLADDPQGMAELRRAGLACLGKVEDPSVMGLLTKPLKDKNASLDLVEGAALGLGHRGDGPAIAALKDALKTQSDRGVPYWRAILEGMAAVEDAAVVPVLQSELQAHRESTEVQAGVIRVLSQNKALVRSAGGTQMVAIFSSDGNIADEARARWMNLLDDVKTPNAKTELTNLSKSTNPRISALAKQKLKGNFGK
ncbi:MAG: hypothetical protein JST54_04540 [Deltaproteobacteria bacterium]|nr:hypothetical protein [Deltaproteobacteria bacterium]